MEERKNKKFRYPEQDGGQKYNGRHIKQGLRIKIGGILIQLFVFHILGLLEIVAFIPTVGLRYRDPSFRPVDPS